MNVEVDCGASRGMQTMPEAATAAETAVCLLHLISLSTKSTTLRTESLRFREAGSQATRQAL